MTLPPTIHASAVAIAGRGVLLFGPSGAGKSDLALRLVDRGALLVADDRVAVARRGDGLWLSAPPPIRGLIEVRGVGILSLPVGECPAALAIELGPITERLPEARTRLVCDVPLPALRLPAFEASTPIRIERALALLGDVA